MNQVLAMRGVFLRNLGIYQFVAKTSSDKFLDLAYSSLKLKGKVTKGDETNLAVTDNTAITNYPMATLFNVHPH